MNQHSQHDSPTPSKKKLLLGCLAAFLVGLALLALVVLPAEYNWDPTGAGKALGLTRLNESTVKTVQITDVIGGNERLIEVTVPDPDEPTPLPNPAVFQDEKEPPTTQTLTITIPAEKQTEVKARLAAGKVIIYAWSVDRGDVYVDFHGHDPALGDEFWVRYKEQQEGTGNNGSLTAPFTGEHGWYWLNYNGFPVEITLTVTGYQDELVEYEVF